MKSSGPRASPIDPLLPRATLTLAASLGWDALRAQIAAMLGDDAHKKTVDATTSVVAALMRANTVALATIATMLAAAHDLLPEAAFQRLDLRTCGVAWVAFVLGERRDVLVALDWTGFVAVHRHGMKEPWLLVCDGTRDDTGELIASYDRRFSIEETFRDQQDPRFGLGLDHVRVGTPAKRDRLLLLAAMAQALRTLLGAAGEACGLDKGLSTSGAKRRVYSLYRQGATWFVLLPTMRATRRDPLMSAFETQLQQHRGLSELLGFL